MGDENSQANFDRYGRKMLERKFSIPNFRQRFLSQDMLRERQVSREGA